MLQVILLLFLTFTTVLQSYGSPRELSVAKRSLANLKKEEKILEKATKKLTASERASLKRTKGKDSDGDGLIDSLETAFGSNRCDADSDDDGLDDKEDEDEDNSDADGDGFSDGVETSAKGAIQAFNDPSLSVSGQTFQLTNTTVFFRGLTSKSDLKVGLCIEVEGHKSGTLNIADKIKLESGSACGNGDD